MKKIERTPLINLSNETIDYLFNALEIELDMNYSHAPMIMVNKMEGYVEVDFLMNESVFRYSMISHETFNDIESEIIDIVEDAYQLHHRDDVDYDDMYVSYNPVTFENNVKVLGKGDTDE